MIRFLEARFAHGHGSDLIETNITPWRRAVVGDLTTAFDFRNPNGSRQVPDDTDRFKPEALVRHPDEVPVPPANQAVPPQEPGVRPARALPYSLDAQGELQSADGSFWIQFRNSGKAAAVFQVRRGGSTDAPRTYTVEAHKRLTDFFPVRALGLTEFDLSVFGPNGFFREFKGAVSGAHRANLDVQADVDDNRGRGHGDHGDGDERGIEVEITNRGQDLAHVNIFDRYALDTTTLVLGRGDEASRTFPLRRTHGWYDLTITVDEDPGFRTQLAGHVENGEDSISDPLIGGLV
jgi:phospholipase C